MTTEFWLGYTLGILTVIAVAVALHLRSEKQKRKAFDQAVKQAEQAHPLPPSTGTTSHYPKDVH